MTDIEHYLPQIIRSVVALAVLLAARFIISLVIGRQEKMEVHRRRKMMVTVRDVIYSLFILFILYVWFPEIKRFATAIMVIAVAIVIAIKEYLLNVMGFLFRSSAHFFSIGDRIEVDGMRGDVVDQTLMGVSMLEVGSGTNQLTGRTIFIPNSKFLSLHVKNETRLKNYVFHLINIPLNKDQNWQEAEKILLDVASETVAPYIDEMQQYLRHISRRHSLETPAVEPRIYIHLSDPEKIVLTLRVPVPIRKRGRLEQQILREYLLRLG